MNDPTTGPRMTVAEALRDEQEAYDDALDAIRAEQSAGRLTTQEAAEERAGLLAAHRRRVQGIRAAAGQEEPRP